MVHGLEEKDSRFLKINAASFLGLVPQIPEDSQMLPKDKDNSFPPN
jgi:hypothetical protein